MFKSLLLKFLVQLSDFRDGENLQCISYLYSAGIFRDLLIRPFFAIEACRSLLASSRFHYRRRIISNSNSQKWKNFKRKKHRCRVNFKENARKFDEPEPAKCILQPSPTSTLTFPWLFVATCSAFPAFVIPTWRRSHIPVPSRCYMRRRQGSFVNLYHDLWGNPI